MRALLVLALAIGLLPVGAVGQEPCRREYSAIVDGAHIGRRERGAPVVAQNPGAGGRTARIEERSPGVFGNSGRRALTGRSVRYRVNATVLIPLLVTSIPLIRRDDVGVGSFIVRDFDDGPDGPLRAYEFFAASIPDRARGLNRLGFIREAVKMDGRDPSWTAQFGVISADRAETREAAESSFDQDQNLQPYTLIDAIIEPQRSWSSVVTIPVPGAWETADALYADTREKWTTAVLEPPRELSNPDRRRYEHPVGFIGAIQRSLLRVAEVLALGRQPEANRQPYVHNGRVLQLEFRGREIDRGKSEDFARDGLVAPDAVVHRLEYRVYSEDGDDIESFELWTELPHATAGGRLPPAIMPLSFELQPRSYLKLTAVQRPN